MKVGNPSNWKWFRNCRHKGKNDNHIVPICTYREGINAILGSEIPGWIGGSPDIYSLSATYRAFPRSTSHTNEERCCSLLALKKFHWNFPWIGYIYIVTTNEEMLSCGCLQFMEALYSSLLLLLPRKSSLSLGRKMSCHHIFVFLMRVDVHTYVLVVAAASAACLGW